MAKKHDIILTVMFCAFVGAMVLGIVLLPKQSVSVNEKRGLASFPKASVEKILSGKWESNFENYISDHFPARDFFVSVDSYYTLYSGRNGAKGVYKGTDGYLIGTPVNCDVKKLRANIDALSDFAENTGLDTELIAVPTAGYVMSDKLPPLHLKYCDGEIISEIKKRLHGVSFIDVTDELINNSGNSPYYKTDHHWTSAGVYISYRKWAQNNSLTPRSDDEYTVETAEGFFGTSYTKSALWNEKSDTIEMWKYPADVTVTIDNAGEYESMFFEEHLKNTDKYPVFLDGNHGFVRIVNHANPYGRRMLVIKDSYANCFVPFMAENCSVIDMIDMRYYTYSVKETAEQNEYDGVLALYGISSLCETTDLTMLN